MLQGSRNETSYELWYWNIFNVKKNIHFTCLNDERWKPVIKQPEACYSSHLRPAHKVNISLVDVNLSISYLCPSIYHPCPKLCSIRPNGAFYHFLIALRSRAGCECNVSPWVDFQFTATVLSGNIHEFESSKSLPGSKRLDSEFDLSFLNLTCNR